MSGTGKELLARKALNAEGGIDPVDLQMMQALVRKMAKRLADRYSRRRNRARKGHLDVRRTLRLTVDALRYLRRETVRRMNRGMTEWEILHDMEYPEAIFGHPFMRPSYGMPEYIVRDIWRSENGWWDRNPTHLHPAAPEAVNAALREAVADPDHLLRCAQAHRDNKRPQLALHVLDLLAPENPGDSYARDARAMKAELLEELAESSTSFVSAQIYRSEAARLARQP
jgi:alkyl sulfatase BDS1-like metallo-beta-lactamase superfamily hydrolase